MRLNKSELLRLVLAGLGDSGLIATAPPEFSRHPLEVSLVDDTGREIHLRIYVWNVTHGGGARRPEDEFRIQITGVRNLKLSPKIITLLLGYDSSRGVLVAFSAEYHQTFSRNSPSVQVRKRLLEEAKNHGIASYFKKTKTGQGEFITAFTPPMIGEYIRLAGALVGVKSTHVEVLEKAMNGEMDDAECDLLPKPRRRTLARVNRVVRDSRFRSLVKKAYGGRCAMCGLDFGLVEGAHAVPINHPLGTDQVINGLCLCPTHHKAYDMGLILVLEDYSIMVNDQRVDTASQQDVQRLRKGLLPSIRLPRTRALQPDTDRLRIHNELFG